MAHDHERWRVTNLTRNAACPQRSFPALSVHIMGTDMVKAKLWWALAAAITLQFFILYYQLNYGALAGLIPWDDCAIVLRGLENLANVAQAHSPW